MSLKIMFGEVGDVLEWFVHTDADAFVQTHFQ